MDCPTGNGTYGGGGCGAGGIAYGSNVTLHYGMTPWRMVAVVEVDTFNGGGGVAWRTGVMDMMDLLRCGSICLK